MDIGITDPIDKSTALRILERMTSTPVIEKRKIPDFVRKLQDLYSITLIEHQRSPKNARSKLDKSLVKLSKDVRSLLLQISGDNLEPIEFALHLAAIDFYRSKGSTERASRNFKSLEHVLKEIDTTLRELEYFILHLYRIIDGFDKMSPEAQSGWFFRGVGTGEGALRQALYPLLRKGGSIGTDTYVMRSIFDLYHYLFGKRFSVFPNSKKPGSKGAARKYGGQSVEFANAVIKELDLTRIFFRQDEVPSMARLHNKIANIWSNDKRRKGSKILHN